MADKLFPTTDAAVTVNESQDVKRWTERLSTSRKMKDDWAMSSGAKRFVQQYKGKFDDMVFTGLRAKIPIPPINEVFAYVQSDIAATNNRNPYLSVNPKAGTVKGAKLWEITLNYYYRHLQVKEETDLEIVDKDLVGSGWHKVGYTVSSVGSGEKLKIASEGLYSMRVDWKDILWNVNAKRPPKDAQWMSQRIVWPLDDIKARFPAARNLQGTPNPEIDKSEYDRSSYKDDIKVGVFHEIWDARKREILLVADGLSDRYLDKPKPWPDYIEEFPFLEHWDFWVPDSAFKLSAIAPWESQMKSEMTLMGMALNHAKRWNRQLFIKGGSIDDIALDKFERGDDGAVITVQGTMDDASFKFADFGQLPTDFYLLMDRLAAIKRNTHGQPEFQQGGVTKTSTRTMGELELMSEGAQSRDARKKDRLETHLRNIGRHMLKHLQSNMDFEQIVKITGDTPQEVLEIVKDHFDPVTKTIKFNPADIAGEYDVDVVAGSTLPLNRENKLKIYQMCLQSIAPIAGKGALSPTVVALLSEILSEYDIKSLQEAYKIEVQQAMEKAQQEAGQMSVEQQKIAAETSKREEQAKEIAAKTAIVQEEAVIGAIGRAQLEKMKSHGPTPSESISFKDLPEAGQVQMAQQAGITISESEAPGIQKPPTPAKGPSQ